jgi:hypothetical protein
MNKSARIDALVSWGQRLKAEKETEVIFRTSGARNAWFTPDQIRFALDGVISWLNKDSLSKWLEGLPEQNADPKLIGLVLAGNIPLVGFHDLLTVIASGHTALVKYASKDEVLIKWVLSALKEVSPELSTQVQVTERLAKFDAVIATGSNNSARYFEHYFGKYPNVIRKNRTSVAVLNGAETEEELVLMGEDVFRFYGLGCRNISHLFVPETFEVTKILDAFKGFDWVMHHHKYKNNYDYNRSLLLLNMTKHLATDFVMLIENESLFSRLTTLHYSTYKNQEELEAKLEKHKENIQCITGQDYVQFGNTQRPAVDDYADGVNTLAFLQELTLSLDSKLE